jgi:cation transport ATPase
MFCLWPWLQGAIWFLGGARNPSVTGIGVICTLVGGFPIFHEAYENIVQRRMTMEFSMAIAIVAALAIRVAWPADYSPNRPRLRRTRRERMSADPLAWLGSWSAI